MELDFYDIAKKRGYKTELERDDDLEKTLKHILSNIRKVCQTPEYNIQSTDIAYVFEHIRTSLIYIFTLNFSLNLILTHNNNIYKINLFKL